MFYKKDNEDYHVYIDRVFKKLSNEEQNNIFKVFYKSYINKVYDNKPNVDTVKDIEDENIIKKEFFIFFNTLNDGNTSVIQDGMMRFTDEVILFLHSYFGIDSEFHKNHLNLYEEFTKKMNW